MEILVTGGAGFIGSHTCIELINSGYKVIVIDNLCNSSIESLRRVEIITGHDITFYKLDIRDQVGLTDVFNKHSIDSVIHFAGLKVAGESINKPFDYYDTNFVGTLVLIRVMLAFKCKSLVFSSSAAVYGDSNLVLIKENFSLSPVNPYGRSKLMVEEFLQDFFVADKTWRIALLRYFNPIGAHESGQIGEEIKGVPNNLMPYISQVANGNLNKLQIFGGDYNTPDGTGVRDYIHVVDLARGHIDALKALDSPQVLISNLGTGLGYSVLDMIKSFEKASGKTIPYQIVDRRAGDIASSYADISISKEKLNWQAKYNLDQMCKDLWRWQSLNPQGYF